MTDESNELPALRVGIIGCGLIGQKRAESLGGDLSTAFFDVNAAAAQALSNEFGGVACSSVDELISSGLDVVVVATTHATLAELSCRSLRAGCHVLVEKPGGIGVGDIDRIVSSARDARRLVKVGFNHRFHPGISTAISDAKSGKFGPILHLRAHYGHGGRLGYENEWRANAELSGGGEIVDQGMHLLDLSYWLLGDLPLHSSLLRTQFWKTSVDDNAVLILSAGDARDSPFSLLDVSWTEWKNSFFLEITCRDAKLVVEGLVRSYGRQTLRIYRMRPELGPPDLEEFNYGDEDVSWELEWRHFRTAIVERQSELLGDLQSARYAWSCVEKAQGSR